MTNEIPFYDGSQYHLQLLAPKASGDGYGYSAELLAIELDKMGVDISFVAYDWNEPFCTDPKLFELESNWGGYEVGVVYFLPYALNRFRAPRTICMTMFETSRIPEIWVQFINTLSDGCIVPSEFCFDTFTQSGVTKPMSWFPLGVDVERYTFVERDPHRTFTFLMSGLLHHRKNPAAAYRAFVKEFAPDEEVSLVFKTRRGFFDIGGEVIDDPRVEVIHADFSRQEMQDLYAHADCLIAPSLGEASGLVPREAMATGLPVILTDWSGLKEIADPAISYPIKVSNLTQAPTECSSYSAGITQGQDIGQWAEVDEGSLAENMRDIFEHRFESLQKGRLARKKMETDFSATRSAELFLEALKKVYDA